MKSLICLLLLSVSLLAGCPPLNAEAVAACGEVCKNAGGVHHVDGFDCICRGK